MIHSAASYIEKAYDPQTRKQIYERIPPRVRELFAFVNKFEWYPAEDATTIFRAIAAYHQETDGKVTAALEGIGRELASTASTTSLQLLFRLMTPALFAKKAPDLWERNSCGDLEVTRFDPDEHRMTMTLKDVDGFEFIGLVAGGFVLFALEAVGCKAPAASFPFDAANPSPARVDYELTWQ